MAYGKKTLDLTTFDMFDVNSMDIKVKVTSSSVVVLDPSDSFPKQVTMYLSRNGGTLVMKFDDKNGLPAEDAPKQGGCIFKCEKLRRVMKERDVTLPQMAVADYMSEIDAYVVSLTHSEEPDAPSRPMTQGELLEESIRRRKEQRNNETQ